MKHFFPRREIQTSPASTTWTTCLWTRDFPVEVLNTLATAGGRYLTQAVELCAPEQINTMIFLSLSNPTRSQMYKQQPRAPFVCARPPPPTHTPPTFPSAAVAIEAPGKEGASKQSLQESRESRESRETLEANTRPCQ